MKANQSLRTDVNAGTYTNATVTLVALLIAIVIGVMVYFSVITNVSDFAATTETFTGYTLPTGGAHTGGSNYTVQHVTLTNTPYSASNSTIAVVCYNSSGATSSSPPVTINGKIITIPAASASAGATTSAVPAGYDEVRVTYTSKTARTQSKEVTPMASTIFTLLPIIALVVIASIILAIILGFGGAGKSGGGL